jgi:DNA-binding NarL/FixJ family response regulator
MAAPFMDELRGLATASAPTVAALLAQAEAEWSRLVGHADPDLWRAARSLLASIPDPYAAAEAAMRAAESALRRDGTRADVEEELRSGARRSRTRLATEEPPAAEAGAEEPRAAPASPLSARELEVLRLVAAGRTNGEIADELFITRKTAGVHVTHILDKLGVTNRVEAAMAGSRLGLLEPRDGAGDP